MGKRIASHFFKIIGILIISVLILLAIIGGYLAGAMLKVAAEAPEINPSDITGKLNENSTIVDKYGTLIETIETEQYRKVVPITQMPKNLLNAFISAEDKRFREHDGIDPIGIVLSIVDNLKAGDIERGASTITQQLTRAIYLDNSVEFKRKIQEMYLALKVDDALSKDQIIEAYLNRVFLGQNAYGVQAASEIYFSKDVQDLNLAQSALLATIVKAPTPNALYKTIRPSEVTTERVLGEVLINGETYVAVYNQRPIDRMRYVLQEMENNGYITAEEHKAALEEDVAASIKPATRRVTNLSTFFTDLVKEQTVQILMDKLQITRTQARNMLFSGGLTITATLDLKMQRDLESMFTNFNEILNGDSKSRTGANNLDIRLNDAGNLVNNDGQLLYYKKSNIISEDGNFKLPNDQFVIEEDGAVRINSRRIKSYDGYISLSDYYTIDDKGILRTHAVSSIPLDDEQLRRHEDGSFTLTPTFLSQNTNFYTKTDDGIEISHAFFDSDDNGVMQPQAATTVIDNRTGEIQAIIGGRDSSTSRFMNRASNFPRQPGSTFKPIAAYTAALDNGYNLASVFDDTPVRLNEEGNPWPSNAYTGYYGLRNIRQALVSSINPIAVKTLDAVGINVSKEYLARMGIINREHPDRDTFIEASESRRANDENQAMALGALTDGITPLAMAEAFSTFGNDGQHIKAMTVSSIVDSSGKVYYENKHEANEVVSPQVNYLMVDALKSVATDEYARQSQIPGIETIGKTGTTQGSSDFWFVGVTPYYTTSVWMGADNAQIKLTGYSSEAIKLYKSISSHIHEGKENKSFTRPDGLVEVEICTLSGKLATANCRKDPRGTIKKELFLASNVPTETCDVHVVKDIDTRNNLLAVRDTPKIYRAQKVFVQRPIPYVPADFKNVVPRDWEYEVPTKYSDLPTVLLPTTVKNPDGSTTVTQLHPNGGSTVVQTFPDGTIIRTVTSATGEVTRTVTPPPTPTPAPVQPEPPTTPVTPPTPPTTTPTPAPAP